MTRYRLVAACFRFFSGGPLRLRLYRALGNRLGARLRAQRGLPKLYLDRARLLIERIARLGLVHDGDRLLELGTGWVHWDSLIIRLFYDVRITLFDVWDNRGLAALKARCAALDTLFDRTFAPTPAQAERAHALLRAISQVASFDALYRLLGWEYVVQPDGELTGLSSGAYNAVYSCNVLEHVRRDSLPAYVADMARVLAPGGYAFHTIDLTDHMQAYAPAASPKEYLRYSEAEWQRRYTSQIAYFNRVQAPEWLQLFEDAGFELLEEEALGRPLGALPVAADYAALSQTELACRTLRVVYRAPGESERRLPNRPAPDGNRKRAGLATGAPGSPLGADATAGAPCV